MSLWIHYQVDYSLPYLVAYASMSSVTMRTIASGLSGLISVRLLVVGIGLPSLSSVSTHPLAASWAMNNASARSRPSVTQPGKIRNLDSIAATAVSEWDENYRIRKLHLVFLLMRSS